MFVTSLIFTVLVAAWGFSGALTQQRRDDR